LANRFASVAKRVTNHSPKMANKFAKWANRFAKRPNKFVTGGKIDESARLIGEAVAKKIRHFCE